MTLFSKGCMTAVALAMMAVSLVWTSPADARDRNEGGRNHRASNNEISGGPPRNDHNWKRKHQVRRDWRFDNNRRYARDDRWRGYGNGNRWQAGNGWRARNQPYYAGRARPYYAGSAFPYYAGPNRPYYAEQYGPERFADNFYGGSISAYQDPGNGNYFYIGGYYDEMGDARGGFGPSVAPQDRAKVIVVTPETETAACSFEAGVCVIRP